MCVGGDTNACETSELEQQTGLCHDFTPIALIIIIILLLAL